MKDTPPRMDRSRFSATQFDDHCHAEEFMDTLLTRIYWLSQSLLTTWLSGLRVEQRGLAGARLRADRAAGIGTVRGAPSPIAYFSVMTQAPVYRRPGWKDQRRHPGRHRRWRRFSVGSSRLQSDERKKPRPEPRHAAPAPTPEPAPTPPPTPAEAGSVCTDSFDYEGIKFANDRSDLGPIAAQITRLDQHNAAALCRMTASPRRLHGLERLGRIQREAHGAPHKHGTVAGP